MPNKRNNNHYRSTGASPIGHSDHPANRHTNFNQNNHNHNINIKFNTNINQNFIDKTFKFSDDIVDPNKYSEYNTENNLVFSRIYPGVVDSILHGIVDNKMITNDGIAIFIEIYSYQKGQG